MKAFVLTLGKYLILVLLISNLIAVGAQYFLQNSSIFKASFLINNFEPEKSFDYFISGSSRGLTSIGSKEIDEELGTFGINLSQDDTGLPSHILMAKHFFESGYKANYCVLVLDDPHFNSSPLELNDNDYRMAQFVNRPYIYEYFKKRERGMFRPFTYGRYLPVLSYGYFNTELFYPALMGMLKPSFRLRFDEKGDYTYPDNVLRPVELISSGEKWRKESVIDNPLIEAFKNYLGENGCELIIYIAPYWEIEIVLTEDLNTKLINHSAELENPDWFYDPIHINSLGKKQASIRFAAEFQDIININSGLN